MRNAVRAQPGLYSRRGPALHRDRQEPGGYLEIHKPGQPRCRDIGRDGRPGARQHRSRSFQAGYGR